MPRIAEALERMPGALESRPLSQDEIEQIAAFWIEQMGDFYDVDEFDDPDVTNEAIGERVQSCVVRVIKQALEQSWSNLGR